MARELDVLTGSSLKIFEAVNWNAATLVWMACRSCAALALTTKSLQILHFSHLHGRYT